MEKTKHIKISIKMHTVLKFISLQEKKTIQDIIEEIVNDYINIEEIHENLNELYKPKK